MKKILIRVAVLLVVFVLALFGFGLNTNQEGANLISEMSAATFPVLSMYYRGAKVAQLYGYANEMDCSSMRDNLVVVRPDRDITLQMQTFGRAVESAKYEIRSLDGGHLYADGELKFESVAQDVDSCFIHLENILSPEKEYQFVVSAKEGQKDISYYTRLVQTDNEYLDELVDFVEDFHQKAFDSKAAKELTTYIEPNAYGNNSDFNKTSINSSFNQITYGEWKPVQLGEEELTVFEYNKQFVVFTVDYVLTHVAQGSEMEYYNAREYYRVGYNENGQRCYLYDFERKVNQIFRSDGDNFSADSLLLGIRDENVNYCKSENERITCFVQEGELWSVNETTHTLNRIYSFRGYEGIDIRENNSDHEIDIFSVEEGGSCNFAVYGYFNRGSHEGECGISVCRYDSVNNTVEELIYIKTDKSANRLIADMDGIIGEDNIGNAYFMNEGRLHKVSLSDGSVEILAEGLTTDRYLYDKKNRYIAWQEVDGDDIHLLSMKSGITRVIEVGETETLSIINFIDDDFIYGRTYASTMAMKNGIYPWNVIEIYSPETGAAKKTYERDGYYVSNVHVGDYTISMDRVTRTNNGSYKETTADSIMNGGGELILDSNVSAEKTDIKQTIYTIKLSSEEENGTFELITSQEVINNQVPKLTLEKGDYERFYVYAKGRCMRVYTNLSEAISIADENRGVVIDATQNLLWSRARAEITNAISLEVALAVGKDTPGSIVRYMFPRARSYNVERLPLTEVLYYISQGIPVIAHDEYEDFLITGYDNNIVRAIHLGGKSGNEYIDILDEKLYAIGGSYTVFINNQ